MPPNEPTIGSKGWVSYRPEIKVLDCTIRDGGLMNNHHFDLEVVRGVYQACVAAGIDYMELGYKTSKKIALPSEYGIWKHCDESHLREVVGEKTGAVKISVMADAERTDYHEDILPRDQSVIDMIRVATYAHQIPTAIDMIKDAHDKGYETTVNLMAVSTVSDWELDDALAALTDSPVDVLYLVDSFGMLYREQVEALMAKYKTFAAPAGKEIGIHTHNSSELAYANTIEAILHGANYLDASMSGLGRGAGNCRTELLLGFLHNPRYRLRPVLQCIQNVIHPLTETFRWGFDIPYMICAQLNQHPRAAMKFMEQPDHRDIVGFYDMMIEEE